MKHHSFLLEIVTDEADQTSQRDIALAVALRLANAGIVIESIRPVGFRSVPEVNAETGDVSNG